MKPKVFLVMAMVALMLMVGWSAYAQKSKRPNMVWEYKRVQILSEEAILRDLGAQGWELVAIDNNSSTISVYVFKRAK